MVAQVVVQVVAGSSPVAHGQSCHPMKGGVSGASRQMFHSDEIEESRLMPSPLSHCANREPLIKVLLSMQSG